MSLMERLRRAQPFTPNPGDWVRSPAPKQAELVCSLMATQYPYGYGRGLDTLEGLERRYGAPMHPEYRRRLFAWLASRGGDIGIGGGWRPTPSDTSQASRNGRSFHQSQRFSSGLFVIAAVDLVHRNGDRVHRSPTWAEVPRQGSGHSDIERFGLHANVNNEPWHLQPVELDGWQTWASMGRRDPRRLEHLDAPTFPTPVGARPNLAAGEFGLYPLDQAKPRLRRGIEAEHVGYAQAVIKLKAGHDIVIDDRFGQQTERSVLMVQRYFDLPTDGVIGPQTWAILDYCAVAL